MKYLPDVPKYLILLFLYVLGVNSDDMDFQPIKPTRTLSDTRTHSNVSDSAPKHSEVTSSRIELESGTGVDSSILNEIKIPKIFFGSRTHKQLVQIVKELKTTAYRPNMTVLGSRDLYCIHKSVSKSQNKTEEW